MNEHRKIQTRLGELESLSLFADILSEDTEKNETLQ